jgi:uncharacterized membrane protein YfcA
MLPDLPPALLVLAAFAISLLASLGGLSGAFLMLPFQVSVLGLTGPSVTATNHLFNVVAIPAGALGLRREGRVIGPLVLAVLAGSLPGMVLGAAIRVRWLAEPGVFRAFSALVLAAVGLPLLVRLPARLRATARVTAPSSVEVLGVTSGTLRLSCEGREVRVGLPALAAVALLVGVLGGAYGIGGGAMLAPILFWAFRLPAHATAGATLVGTLLSSAVALAAFLLLPGAGGPAAGPDWSLGLLLGAGGMLGIACGARLQRHVRSAWIEGLVGVLVTGLAGLYALQALGG